MSVPDDWDAQDAAFFGLAGPRRRSAKTPSGRKEAAPTRRTSPPELRHTIARPPRSVPPTASGENFAGRLGRVSAASVAGWWASRGPAAGEMEEYVDPTFGPDPALEELVSPSDEGEVEVWSRPRDLDHDGVAFIRGGSRAFVVFDGTPSAQDVHQGRLGDCWFLSALGSLAEFQAGEYLLRLFDGTERRRGKHVVLLCIAGAWERIPVDDRLPATKGATRISLMGVEVVPRRLVYCGAPRRQLWAPLIEKAYAKYCGGYDALVGGNAAESLSVFTGWPVMEFDLGEGDAGDAEVLFAKLLSSHESGYLMVLSSTDSPEHCQAAGLKPSHAYSILAVYSDVRSSVHSAVGERLLRVRNPHGRGEWQGDWSAHSPLWSDELRAALRYQRGINDGDDGEFFMKFADVRRFFRSATICPLREHRAGWVESRLRLTLPCDWRRAQPTVRIEAFETVECIVHIAQTPTRARRAHGHRGTEASFALLRCGPGGALEGATFVACSKHHSDVTHASDEVILTRGNYVLVPFAFGNREYVDEANPAGFDAGIGCCVHSSGAILCEEGFTDARGVAQAVRCMLAGGCAAGEAGFERGFYAGMNGESMMRKDRTGCVFWLDNRAAVHTLTCSLQLTVEDGETMLSVPPTAENMRLLAHGRFEAVVPPKHGALAFAVVRRRGQRQCGYRWDMTVRSAAQPSGLLRLFHDDGAADRDGAHIHAAVPLQG